MSELSPPLYNSSFPGDDDWSWTARFKLPAPLPREEVMAEIHRGVQAMRYSTVVPLEKLAEAGLSGFFTGAEGDDDAEVVNHVTFYTDPSKTYGERPVWHSDPHAVRIAEVNRWEEIDQDSLRIIDNRMTERGMVRAVIGRNKDKYGGQEAFTYDEARRMMLPDTDFATYGGYHISSRPGWTEPYGEPALIAETSSDLYDADNDGPKQELMRVGWGLGQQHRFTVGTPWGVEVFEINEQHPDFDKRQSS